ncbi:hypothetical protein [Methylobacter sp.]|uniref:hypothetical protein n=1 Tax=Methylobacter sp. TaxID=2051955 RepID=UPI003DA27401
MYKKDNDPGTILLPGHTCMDEALRSLSFHYVQHDFTANIRNHWLKNYEFSQTPQPDFAAEGNAFLCEARMAENGWSGSCMLSATVRIWRGVKAV